MAHVGRDLHVGVRVVADLPWAWEHQCGALNKGAYVAGASCGGCRFETRESEVRRYLLVSTESGGED